MDLRIAKPDNEKIQKITKFLLQGINITSFFGSVQKFLMGTFFFLKWDI